MKRQITFLFAAIFLLFAFRAEAEIHNVKRFFEVGIDTTFGFSNNYFDLRDILVEDIVFNLQKIADGMPDDGWVIDFQSDMHNYVQFGIDDNFRFKFYANIEGSGYMNIEKSLFEVLGNGYSVGDKGTFNLDAYADLFLDTGVSFSKTVKGIGFTLGASYFMPLIYVPDTKATVSYGTSSSGLIYTYAQAPVTIYSAMSLESLIEDSSFTQEEISDLLESLMTNGGFDISFSVEKQVVRTLNLGLFTRVPIIPGHLKYKASTVYSAWFYETNFLGYIDETEESDYDYTHDDFTYSSADYTVHRPFKLGIEGAWRPFGSWCTFAPMLAFVIRNPYSSDYICYPEYSLSADFTLIKIFGLFFETAYLNRVFTQRIGLSINAHLVELSFKAGFRSADFLNSFGWTGATLTAGIKAGL